MTMVMDIENRLREALDGVKGLAAAYLFGSIVANRFGAESDVDLALLFLPKDVPDALGRFELANRLSCVLGFDVDVVVLNTAGPVIGMQVLRKGKKFIEKDRRATNEFFVRCVNEYADLKIVRAPIERQILNGRIIATTE